MRAIEFRGLDVVTNEWVYGNLFSRDALAYIENEDSRGCWFETEVKPETVSQYTGFKDKKKNKIFDKDIADYKVKYADGTEINTWLLEWIQDMCRFELSHYIKGKLFHSFYFNSDVCADLEVIGSIHLNHELLEGRE